MVNPCNLLRRKFINADFTSRVTYPDPFKPTGIEFDLPEDAHVTLTLFDHVGSELSKLITNQLYKAGTHTIDFTAKGYTKGIYFYRLLIQSGEKKFIDTKRIVIEN